MNSKATSADQAAANERTAAAYGLAAVIAIVFNTVLAWVKDAYEPLNHLMALLTGHHWITHALFDVVVFIALGWAFTSKGIPAQGVSKRLAIAIAAAVLIGGAGLAGWFLVV